MREACIRPLLVYSPSTHNAGTTASGLLPYGQRCKYNCRNTIVVDPWFLEPKRLFRMRRVRCPEAASLFTHAVSGRPTPPRPTLRVPQVPNEVEFLPQLQPKRRPQKPRTLPRHSGQSWDAGVRLEDRCIPHYNALSDPNCHFVRSTTFRKHYQSYLEMKSDARVSRSHSLATRLSRASMAELHSSSAPHLPVAGMGGLLGLEVTTVRRPPAPAAPAFRRLRPLPHPPGGHLLLQRSTAVLRSSRRSTSVSTA